MMARDPARLLTTKGHSPRVGPDPRLIVDLITRDAHQIVPQIWRAVGLWNRPERLFRYGTRLALVTGGGLIDVDVDLLSAIASDAARFRDGRRGAYVPDRLIRQMLADPDPPLPRLDRILPFPALGPDGRSLSRSGYDAASCTYVALPPALANLPVPVHPSDADAARALAFLRSELLPDFPFASPADFAAALALLLTPFLLPMIDGPLPGFLLQASGPGVGKSLIARTIGAVVTGADLPLQAFPRDDAEMRKTLTAIIFDAPPLACFDNVPGTVNSAPLAAALTARWWSDRRLGETRRLTLPITTLFIVTANNATVSRDIARRVVPCNLDAGVEDPAARTGFRHGLPGWAVEHRAELVAAVLMLACRWVAVGRPAFEGPTFGSFELWLGTVGGLLQSVGVGGLLENRADFRAAADDETDALRRFVGRWLAERGTSPVTTAELHPLACSVDGLDLGPGDERAQRHRLGKLVSKMRGRILLGFRVVGLPIRDGTRRWALELTGEHVLALARDFGWTAVKLRHELVIGASEAAWCAFVTGASQSDLAAVARLLSGEGP